MPILTQENGTTLSISILNTQNELCAPYFKKGQTNEITCVIILLEVASHDDNLKITKEGNYN